MAGSVSSLIRPSATTSSRIRTSAALPAGADRRDAHMVRTPAGRARPARHSCGHRREERRGRRHHHRSYWEEGSTSSTSRRRHEEADRDSRWRERRHAGLEDSAEVPASSPSPTKKPRLRSEVGLVRGCSWRFDDDPFNPQEHNAAPVPSEDGVAVAPTPSSSAPALADNCDGVIFAPDEAATTKGSAGTASTSITTAAPPETTTALLFACRLSVPTTPPPPWSTQAAPQALIFTGTAAAPPPLPACTPCRPSPKRMKMAIPSASRPAYAVNPSIPAFPIVAPPQQQEDPDKLRRAKVQMFAGLIAKKQQETTERYGNLLRTGKAPPEPPKPAVDEDALRLAAARKRFREALAQEERKARGAALFVQMARPGHLRALGIDKAMERVVSPERPRDENGAPVVSPEHPCSPLEKLGYFLKVEYIGLEEDVVLAGTSE